MRLNKECDQEDKNLLRRLNLERGKWLLPVALLSLLGLSAVQQLENLFKIRGISMGVDLFSTEQNIEYDGKAFYYDPIDHPNYNSVGFRLASLNDERELKVLNVGIDYYGKDGVYIISASNSVHPASTINDFDGGKVSSSGGIVINTRKNSFSVLLDDSDNSHWIGLGLARTSEDGITFGGGTYNPEDSAPLDPTYKFLQEVIEGLIAKGFLPEEEFSRG